MDALAALNLALAGYMTGVVWLVQRVHYPLLAHVAAPRFGGHARRITPVVGPPMLAQAAVAAPLAGEGALGAANAALVAVVLLSTVLVFGPMHSTLTAEGVGRLVARNRLRTALWSAQLAVALALAL
jgi:hypothetical protein